MTRATYGCTKAQLNWLDDVQKLLCNCSVENNALAVRCAVLNVK